MKKVFYLAVWCLLQWPMLAGAAPFVVERIVVEGTQRITPATVEHYLSIKPGHVLQPSQTSALLRQLYQTGFFEHIALEKTQHTLIVRVVEHPTIAQVNISGNKAISTDQLKDVMKRLDVVEGSLLKANVVSSIKQNLLYQYRQLGYHHTQVTVTTTALSHHRVILNMMIVEGNITRVRGIHIVGNHVFDEQTLLKQLELTTPGILTWFTHRDRYAEEKLTASLEKLRLYYMDHGYLHFAVQSVKTETDHDAAYIVITVNEGKPYAVHAVRITGATAGLNEEMRKFITIQPGDVFSRQAVIDTEKAMLSFLGEHGYLFATIILRPQVNDQQQSVIVVFDVTVGKRVYVRQITFLENYRTNDEVLRREVLQWESAPASMTKLESSKQRLLLLPFIKETEMAIEPVPNKTDLVDVHYRVKEDNAATATFKVGYSQIERIIFGLGFSQKNFLGTGSALGVNFQHSQYEQFDSIEYTNPYYTPDGISRTIRLSSSRVDPQGAGVNNGYTTNEYDADVLYGIPLGQAETIINRAYVGVGYQNSLVHIIPGSFSNQINYFITQHGTHFQVMDMKAGYSRDSRDRAIFPTRGVEQSLFVDAFAPLTATSTSYYTLNYHAKWYQPIYGPFIALTRTDLGYGNGYHGVNDYPFFRNYYAGGIDSIRGFQGYTLGPRDSNGKPFGGNLLATGSVGLIFPNGVSENLRTAAFVDLGNVYTTLHNRRFGGQSTDSGPIRYSTGVEADFLTPLGPMRVSLARALNIQRRPSDYVEAFQFSIGTSF